MILTHSSTTTNNINMVICIINITYHKQSIPYNGINMTIGTSETMKVTNLKFQLNVIYP